MKYLNFTELKNKSHTISKIAQPWQPFHDHMQELEKF